jgi:hypothetical protein
MYTKKKGPTRFSWILRFVLLFVLVSLTLSWIYFFTSFDIRRWASKKYDLLDPKNPVMYMDIKIGEEIIGRIVVELYAHITPKVDINSRDLTF